MERARHLVHEAIFAAAIVVAVIVPIVSILYDERQGRLGRFRGGRP